MKRFTRIITLILASLLLLSTIGALASCDSITYKLRTAPDKIEDKTGKLTDDMKSEIQLAYNKKNKEFLSSPKYVEGICYGVFDNAYCLIIEESGECPCVVVEETVAGFTFEFSNPNHIMTVYCEGEFYRLSKAYENGILDESEIKELYYFYTKEEWGLDYSNYTPEQPSLQVMANIQNAYFEKTYEEEHKDYYNSPDQVHVEYYGSFNNAYCVMITCPLYEYASVMTEVTVGGYTFIFGSSNTMQVFFEGEFYGLKQAYEYGILDNKALFCLYNYYIHNYLL